MKPGAANPSKEFYRRFRKLSWERLWGDEVPRFDGAPAQQRVDRVALIRAVGVVFSESGTSGQQEAVRLWLRNLLEDPSEKVRRYAMAALPKIGAGATEEAQLLSLLRRTTVEREKRFLGRTLEKIGGAGTLNVIKEGTCGSLQQAEQKVKASLARNQSPSTVRTDRLIPDFHSVRIHLRGRRGLESFVREEVEASARTRDRFRVREIGSGLVALIPLTPFALADLYALRCFGTVGFVLGSVDASDQTRSIDALAGRITSPLSRRLLKTLTEGSVRYRLEFVSQGHQRAAVRLLTDRAYAICPEILNDPRRAPWVVAVHPAEKGSLVELSPKLKPDPRFTYRQHDVPAASHPPLAACMARLAGRVEGEIVWDPFCGSGVELIERSLLGGVRSIFGTDLSATAIAIAQDNFAAANVKSVQSKFTRSDFRDFAKSTGLRPRTASLIITNPPMGKRVPITNLPGLIADLFIAAEAVLKPGGRLVFANPLQMESPIPSLELQSRQVVDLGGFDCRLEKYVKSSR